MRSSTIATTKLASDKRGNPRIWIEGRKLEAAGFIPSVRYRMTVDSEARRIELRVDDKGDRVVSRRERRGQALPIIDIANAKALSTIPADSVLRIDFSAQTIVIEMSATERRRLEREERTITRLRNGDPLATGSVSTGIGALSYAIHQGLAGAGIPSRLAFSVEIDHEYQDICAQRNPIWNEGTQAICMPMQEFAFDRNATGQIEQVDVLEAGIPCTAHSLAGRAKKHLEIPEHDPVAGHLVVGFLAIVAACNPSVVIVENVPQYAESASFAILRNQLTEWGYDVDHVILKGEEFACLEHRHRMALIATTKGMHGNVEITADGGSDLKLADILEDVPDDSPLWSEMTYLKEKEERDMAEGKGFRMQILTPDARKVGTIGRGYAKVRSTEPKLQHPTRPEMLRQFTPVEHARIKGIPEVLVEGLSVTQAHEMLGQSIVTAPFRALGEGLGRELVRWNRGGQPRAKVTVAIPVQCPGGTNDNDERQLGLFA